jgi:hypothetical protein
MGRIPNLKRLRARTTEEQMLATMLVAGLVFAVVSLVAFIRPGSSGSTANAKGPEIRASAHSRPPTTPSNDSSSSADTAAAQAGASAPAATVTQQLQGLFASVLTPLGFNTSLPTNLVPNAPNTVPFVNVSAGPTTTTFPTTFQPLPGTLPPPPPVLPPVTQTLPPTTLPPTTLPPTTAPPTTAPPTTHPPTTAPPTTAPPTTAPPTTAPPTTAPPTTAPPTSTSAATTTSGPLPVTTPSLPLP